MNIDNEIKLLFQEATYVNSNKKANRFPKKIVLYVFLGISLLGLTLLYLYTTPIRANFYESYCEKETSSHILLSQEEKNQLKKAVWKLAKKERKHTNTIHAELRNRFNYRSYHYLNTEQYHKVKTYLQSRLK